MLSMMVKQISLKPALLRLSHPAALAALWISLLSAGHCINPPSVLLQCVFLTAFSSTGNLLPWHTLLVVVFLSDNIAKGYFPHVLCFLPSFGSGIHSIWKGMRGGVIFEFHCCFFFFFSKCRGIAIPGSLCSGVSYWSNNTLFGIGQGKLFQ